MNRFNGLLGSFGMPQPTAPGAQPMAPPTGAPPQQGMFPPMKGLGGLGPNPLMRMAFERMMQSGGGQGWDRGLGQGQFGPPQSQEQGLLQKLLAKVQHGQQHNPFGGARRLGFGMAPQPNPNAGPTGPY